jgi:hypothetical protein
LATPKPVARILVGYACGSGQNVLSSLDIIHTSGVYVQVTANAPSIHMRADMIRIKFTTASVIAANGNKLIPHKKKNNVKVCENV